MAELYVDPSIPRFTREEIVAELDPRFGLSAATFRHYQDLGLVAAPHHNQRWTKDRLGSKPAMWSFNDKEMLRAVLELRQRHHDEVGGQLSLSGLGNFVVWSWVYRDGFVTLEQCRRALRTWVTPQLGGATGGARSLKWVRTMVRQRIDQAAAPGVPLRVRKEVANKVTERLWAGDHAGLRALVGDVTRVVDPQGIGRRVGAPGADVDPAGELEILYLTHRGADAVVSGTPPTVDEEWEGARQLLRVGWAGYQVDQPRLAATSTVPGLFPEADFNFQLARCSATLLMVLGARVVDQDVASGEPPQRH